MTMTTKITKDSKQYIRRIPRSIRLGRVLAHNQVMHAINQPPDGLLGFRAWTWLKADKPSRFRKCKCGWAGLPHYAAGAFNCRSWETINHVADNPLRDLLEGSA
jgi:hypothetical protein